MGEQYQKVKWKIEKLHMLSSCPQKYPEEWWKSYFYSGIPKLSTQNKQGNLAVDLPNQIWTKKGPACKLSMMNFWLCWWKYILNF